MTTVDVSQLRHAHIIRGPPQRLNESNPELYPTRLTDSQIFRPAHTSLSPCCGPDPKPESPDLAQCLAQRAVDILWQCAERDVFPPSDMERLFGVSMTDLPVGRAVFEVWQDLVAHTNWTKMGVVESIRNGSLPQDFEKRVKFPEYAPEMEEIKPELKFLNQLRYRPHYFRHIRWDHERLRRLARFRVDEHVRVEGLVKARHHNGQVGKVIEVASEANGKRWLVELLASGGKVLCVRSEHLVRVM